MEQNGHALKQIPLPRWLPDGEIEDEWGIIPSLPQYQRDPATGKAVEDPPEIDALRSQVISRTLRAFALLPDDDPPGTYEELVRIFGPS